MKRPARTSRGRSLSDRVEDSPSGESRIEDEVVITNPYGRRKVRESTDDQRLEILRRWLLQDRVGKP